MRRLGRGGRCGGTTRTCVAVLLADDNGVQMIGGLALPWQDEVKAQPMCPGLLLPYPRTRDRPGGCGMPYALSRAGGSNPPGCVQSSLDAWSTSSVGGSALRGGGSGGRARPAAALVARVHRLRAPAWETLALA